MRNDLIKLGYLPLFKCLCKNRVVCVSTGAADDGDGIIHRDAPFHEQTDEFRNDHSRVGIIDLDHRIILQIVELTASCGTFVQNQLCTGGYHEILLVDAQESTGFIAVIGVEKQREILCDLGFIKVDAVLYNRFIYAFNIEETQFIGHAAVARDMDLVETGCDRKITESYWIGDVCTIQPAMII